MKKLGFGFMRLPLLDANDPASFDEEQICKMADAFLAAGFTYFDTAYVYHGGKSEEMLRKAVVERYPREQFFVADKLPTFSLKTPEDVPRIFQEQLDRTGLKYFDNYLLHCLDTENYAIAERFDCFSFCLEQKRLGKIRHFGFSFHDTAELLDEILTAHPEVEFVQLQINYLDWESEKVQSRLCYETAVRHGKRVIIMEPVKGGKLVNIPADAEARLKALEPALSVPSWAIRFAASLPETMMVLSGMSSFEQLSDNIGYMQDFKPLTDDETRLCLEIGEQIAHQNDIACTACHYCTEGCPMAISIPEYFALMNRQADAAEYTALTVENGKASDCIECGQCEEHCPQHLPIIDLLKTVASAYEA